MFLILVFFHLGMLYDILNSFTTGAAVNGHGATDFTLGRMQPATEPVAIRRGSPRPRKRVSDGAMPCHHGYTPSISSLLEPSDAASDLQVLHKPAQAPKLPTSQRSKEHLLCTM